MVKAKLSNDNKWIIVEATEEIELKQLKLSFTKKINSWYIIKKTNPFAVVDENFMNAYGMIPVGLWVELINICKKFHYQLEFENDFNCRIKDCGLSKEKYEKYISTLFSHSKISPKDYQTEGVYNILLYKNCCAEVSTSGGKTLMTYMMFKYMIDVIGLKHILFVTPKTNLTTQSAEKFKEYDEMNGVLSDWTFGEIHANAKKKNEYDETIVFGNYQSLCKKKVDFFKKFECVIIDECHHSKNTSIRNLLNKCTSTQYKIGLTGTFPEDESYDNYVIQSHIGPIVYRLSSFDLINKEKFATPVIITAIVLNYLDKEQKTALQNLRKMKKKDDPTAGAKLLAMERNLARENPLRFRYICDMIMKTTKNTLVIFSDIQTEYGVKIYNFIKENTDKNVYYIDGGTPTKNRETIKENMENDMNGKTIIIASMGCFSEGIDIANLWNIFLVESTKSDTILAQILGRGMRRFEGKDKTMLIDFIDDFRDGGGYFNENYLYRHGRERLNIYKKRGFPVNEFEFVLTSKIK